MNKKQELSETQTLPWDLPRFRNWVSIARAHNMWEKVLTESLAPLGIQLAHYDVLANIFHVPGLSQQALAEKLLVGRSAMSMLLPVLEKRGLIEGKWDVSEDRPRKFYAVTQAGREMRAELLQIWERQDEIIKKTIKENRHA